MRQHENGNSSSNAKADDALREIPKLTGIYARSRSLAGIVDMVVRLLWLSMFGALWYLLMQANEAGNEQVAALCGVLLLNTILFGLWYVRRGSPKITRAIAAVMYSREGQVGPRDNDAAIHPAKWGFAEIAYMLTVIACIEMGLFGFIPAHITVPLSALVVVPYMIWALYRKRERASALWNVAPALYVLYSILLLVDFPFYFDGPFAGQPRMAQTINIPLAIIVSWLIAGIIVHIHSRFVLARLRRAAAMPSGEGQ